MSQKKRILTGVKPTGMPHLGNYIGAMKPAIELTSDPTNDAYYFIADYHTLTTCLLYTSPSPRDQRGSRMPSSA